MDEEDPPELNTITRRRKKKKKNIRRESIKGIKISSLAERAAVVSARLQTNNQGKKQTNTKQ